MIKANSDIKAALKKCNVKQWELADKMGYSHNYLCVLFRHELNSKKKLEIYDLIQQIANEKYEVKS